MWEWIYVGTVFWRLLNVNFRININSVSVSLIQPEYELNISNIFGSDKLTCKLTESKLIHMHISQKRKLEEIQKEVSKAGGDVSSSQLIRDGIELLFNYKEKIIERYTPKTIRELIETEGR